MKKAKLKAELQKARQDLAELVLNPDSHRSAEIKRRVHVSVSFERVLNSKYVKSANGHHPDIKQL